MTMEIKFHEGDRVFSELYGAGVIVAIDHEDAYVPYQVKFDRREYAMWMSNGSVRFVSGSVTLDAEQAARVREALEAIGWDREDLGPLAAPEKPKKVIKATITLPDDDQLRYARADMATAVEGWNGTIEYED